MQSKDERAIPRILYCVSSVGLGHVRRSVSIADALRKLDAQLPQINWIAAEPVRSFLEERGEVVLEVSKKLGSMSIQTENRSRGGKISDMALIARKSARAARANYSLLRPCFRGYDLLIQDEFVETTFSFLWDSKATEVLPKKRVLITDYVRLETSSLNPINRLVISYSNRVLRRAFLSSGLRIFAEDSRSLPGSKRLAKWVEKNFQIVGPIVGEIPSETKDQLRKEIMPNGVTSMGNRRIVTFSIGGTSIGKPLLDFAISNSDYLSLRLDCFIIVLVGPRVSTKQDPIRSENLRIVPFTTDALKYFKMADCVVAQAGASTLNEVAALGVPCVCLPISNHWEQKANAERFSKCHGFVKLDYSQLTKENLVGAIEEAIKKPTSHFSFSNPKKTAELILNFARDFR